MGDITDCDFGRHEVVMYQGERCEITGIAWWPGDPADPEMLLRLQTANGTIYPGVLVNAVTRPEPEPESPYVSAPCRGCKCCEAKASRDEPVSMTTRRVTGYEVYRWPEFTALMQRLGIATEVPTVDLLIYVPLVGCVDVFHTYRGRDTTAAKESERNPT